MPSKSKTKKGKQATRRTVDEAEFESDGVSAYEPSEGVETDTQDELLDLPLEKKRAGAKTIRRTSKTEPDDEGDRDLQPPRAKRARTRGTRRTGTTESGGRRRPRRPVA